MMQMQYGSGLQGQYGGRPGGPPVGGSSLVGGGSCLEPRVIGGGLAALGEAPGQFQGQPAGFQGSSNGQFSQSRSIGFADDGFGFGGGMNVSGSFPSPVGQRSMPQREGIPSYSSMGANGSATPIGMGMRPPTAAQQASSDGKILGVIESSIVREAVVGPQVYPQPRQVQQSSMQAYPGQPRQAAYMNSGLQSNANQYQTGSYSPAFANVSEPQMASQGQRAMTIEELQARGHQVGQQSQRQVRPDGSVMVQPSRSSPAPQFQQAAPQQVGGPQRVQMAGNMGRAGGQVVSAPYPEPQAIDQSQSQVVCNILPIPNEYMKYISEEDLKAVQEMTGCTIQHSRPDANSGTADWEVRLFGSQEAKAQAHQTIENLLNDRLAESQNVPSEVLNLPSEYTWLLYQDDIDEIKASTGCEIILSEPEAGSAEGGLQMTLLGSDQCRETAHRAVEDLLSQRVQEQQEQQEQEQQENQEQQEQQQQQQQQQQQPQMREMPIETQMPQQSQEPMTMQQPMMQSQEPMAQPMTMVGTNEAMQGRVISGGIAGMDFPQQEAFMGASMPSAAQPQTMAESPAMTSVLQLPNDYMMLLYQEDIDQLKAEIGCDVQINESEQGGVEGGWTITLLGGEEQRDNGHRAIEDLLTSRVNEAQQQQDGQVIEDSGGPPPEQPMANMEGDSEMVPCTILPIPIDYLKKLYNLDQIQEITHCTITTTPPQDGSPDWHLNLYGDASQRQRAHQAIEDTLNAAMSDGDLAAQ